MGELWKISFTEEGCLQSETERCQRNGCSDVIREHIPQVWSIKYKSVADIFLEHKNSETISNSFDAPGVVGTQCLSKVWPKIFGKQC